jgi:hypothetical protein
MLGCVVVNEMSKGTPVTAHSAIEATTTSAVIDCRGKNAILVHITIAVATKKWTTKIQGSFTKNGTFVDLYELANTGSMAAMSYQCDASRMILFKGIPDYIKIVATEDEDGAKYSAVVQPLIV